MVEFDEQLKNRLLAFQRTNGINPNGIAGAQTWQALVAGSAPAKPATKAAKPKRLKNGELDGVKLIAGKCNHPDHEADVLSIDEVARHAKDAGFKGEDLVIAVAIAKAESQLDRTCYGSTHDLGLWQINQINWPDNGGKDALYDAAANARAAFKIYRQSGKKFDKWNSFNDDKHDKYMKAARAAVNAITAKPKPKP